MRVERVPLRHLVLEPEHVLEHPLVVEVDVAVVGELAAEAALGVLRHEPAVGAGDRGLGDAERAGAGHRRLLLSVVCPSRHRPEPICDTPAHAQPAPRAHGVRRAPAAEVAATSPTSTPSGPGSSAGTRRSSAASRPGRAALRQALPGRRGGRCPGGFPSYTCTAARRTPERTVVYVHGGGFVAPIDPFQVRYVARLACALNARVVHARLPAHPEHTWRDSHETSSGSIQRATGTSRAGGGRRRLGRRRHRPRARSDGARPRRTRSPATCCCTRPGST